MSTGGQSDASTIVSETESRVFNMTPVLNPSLLCVILFHIYHTSPTKVISEQKTVPDDSEAITYNSASLKIRLGTLAAGQRPQI